MLVALEVDMVWWLASVALGATFSGGDYGGADLMLADGDQLEGDLVNVGTLTIPAGAMVGVVADVPLVVQAVEIVIDGHLDGDGSGRPASALPGDGLGPGGGQGSGSSVQAAGGAGHGGQGGSGDSYKSFRIMTGGAGGRRYGSADDPSDAPLGSSGGSKPGVTVGGAGGGSITLIADAVVLSATGAVTADGADGADGVVAVWGNESGKSGGGGGSGGSVVIDAVTVTLDGVVTASGGAGGDSETGIYGLASAGGGGGGGRIKVFGEVLGVGVEIAAQGGSGGVSAGLDPRNDPSVGSPGGQGTVWIDSWVAGPPTLALSGASEDPLGLEVTGATPLGGLLVLSSPAAGADALPSEGPCPGLVTGLSAPWTQHRRVADAAGAAVDRASRGALYQVVDLWSCTLSDVVGDAGCVGDDASGDSDLDQFCDDVDSCPGGDDRDDVDNDGLPAACDPCPRSSPDDRDGDGVCDDVDACLGYDDGVDSDADAVPDACDDCPDAYDPSQGDLWSLVPGAGSSQLLASGANGVTAVVAADLDLDGDPDALAALTYDDAVVWYENVGGAFGPEQIISASTPLPSDVFAEDLDGDGDPDVLVTTRGDDRLAWYENLGGTFAPPRVLEWVAPGASSVFAADLDGDGDADVLSAFRDTAEVVWYENLPGDVFGPKLVVSALADGVGSVTAADLDGDGALDVLAGAGASGEVTWHPNLGGGVFGGGTAVGGLGQAESVDAADLDGDGDLDVVAATGSSIAWSENLGGATFEAYQDLVLGTDLWSAHAVDLDLDGDPDVFGTDATKDQVGWVENLGGGSFSGVRLVATGVDGATSARAADLDGDGDDDLLSAAYYSDEILWHENLADSLPVDSELDGVCDASDVCPADFDPDQLDSDGDGIGDVCDP